MFAKNSALVLIVYVAAGCALVFVAVFSFALYRGSADAFTSPRTQSSGVAGRASPGQYAAPARPPNRRPVIVEDRRRIGQLEAQLRETNAALNQKTALLNKTAAECRALKEELDQYVALAAQLTAVDAEAPGDEGGQEAAADRGELEAELRLVKEELEKSLVLETAMELRLNELTAELASANGRIAELEEEAGLEIAGLVDEGSFLRDAAATTLARVGAAAVPALVDMLADPRPEARKWAAEMLGALGPEGRDAIPSLIEALSDSDEEVRSSVLRALRSVRD
jgi:hypothetical protein